MDRVTELCTNRVARLSFSANGPPIACTGDTTGGLHEAAFISIIILTNELTSLARGEVTATWKVFWGSIVSRLVSLKSKDSYQKLDATPFRRCDCEIPSTCMNLVFVLGWYLTAALKEPDLSYKRLLQVQAPQAQNDGTRGWSVHGYSLSVSTEGPIENNELVNIRVNTSKPNSTHWIAAYSPAGANIRCSARCPTFLTLSPPRGGARRLSRETDENRDVML
eukprot:1178425-Prorocentrum_minimum.AAC.2